MFGFNLNKNRSRSNPALLEDLLYREQGMSRVALLKPFGFDKLNSKKGLKGLIC